MTKVMLTWEFEVDDSWGETPAECIKIAKEEFKTKDIEDLDFKVISRIKGNISDTDEGIHVETDADRENLIEIHADSDILIYVPDTEEFLHIYEGTGDNLLKEDISKGYVDYINIDILQYTSDGYLGEVIDGEMLMLKEYYKERYATNEQVISDALIYSYDQRIPYVEIKIH